MVDLDHPPGRDESTFLVGLLTAISRPNLWLAPGFLVRAPEISGAGTGKGLLVRSICAIAFGIHPRAFTKGGDRQELDKRLASDLIEAAPVLFLDNVNGCMLRSDLLASVLTERPARVRPLGRTKMLALNCTAFIAVTGNGLTLSEDLVRRFLLCELDARCEDPEQRSFGSDYLAKIELRRAELLAAALTIWRWGRQNSPNLVPGRPLGSFEQWAEWCRDPLLALGCRDPVERMDEIKSDDPHRRQIVELFAAWAAHHGDDLSKRLPSLSRCGPWSIHRDGAANISRRGSAARGHPRRRFRLDAREGGRTMGCRYLFLDLHVIAATSAAA